MEEIIAYCVLAGMTYWCAWVAQKNHRNVPLAALWGVLFGIFSVIVYYIMGDKNKNLDIHKEVKDYEQYREAHKLDNELHS